MWACLCYGFVHSRPETISDSTNPFQKDWRYYSKRVRDRAPVEKSPNSPCRQRAGIRSNRGITSDTQLQRLIGHPNRRPEWCSKETDNYIESLKCMAFGFNVAPKAETRLLIGKPRLPGMSGLTTPLLRRPRCVATRANHDCSETCPWPQGSHFGPPSRRPTGSCPVIDVPVFH